MVIHGILEMVDGHCQFEGLTMMRFNGWLRFINAEFSFLTRCELNLKTTSPENADDMKLEQVVEENLPFILSSSEDCETDELSELLTNKVKSKSRKRASEKSNKKSMGSINKSIKKESDSKRSEVFEDNLSELRRNKWRTVVINVGGVNYRSIRLFQINSILTMNLVQCQMSRSKISNFSKYPESGLHKIFCAKTKAEILEYCDGYTAGSPPVIFFDRN